MLENNSSLLIVGFSLTTFLSIYLFYKAAGNSRTVLSLLLGWIVLQAAVSFTGFYLNEDMIPPRMGLLAGPAVLFIIILFLTQSGRSFIDSLNLKKLTWLHTVRIPVELILYGLMLEKALPEMLTFAGGNFDILSGLSAPLAVYFGFRQNEPKKSILLTWNIVCLCLLVNIVLLAVLSAPTSLQQFAFDRPNIAILYFPYVWLPCCVVPLVLLSHLASIRQLMKKEKGE